MTTKISWADHPIIFKGDMVKAILDGCKTQTRRIIKPQPEDQDGYYFWWKGDWDTRGGPRAGVCTHGKPGNGEPTWTLEEIAEHCPYGVPGDLLWVRETFQVSPDSHEPDGHYNLTYLADNETVEIDYSEIDMGRLKPGKKYSSIFMPKWACRLWLRVKSVRVERVQEISEADAKAEGCKPENAEVNCPGGAYRNGFCGLWDSINKGRGFGWDVNPFVRVVGFERKEV